MACAGVRREKKPEFLASYGVQFVSKACIWVEIVAIQSTAHPWHGFAQTGLGVTNWLVHAQIGLKDGPNWLVGWPWFGTASAKGVQHRSVSDRVICGPLGCTVEKGMVNPSEIRNVEYCCEPIQQESFAGPHKRQEHAHRVLNSTVGSKIPKPFVRHAGSAEGYSGEAWCKRAQAKPSCPRPRPRPPSEIQTPLSGASQFGKPVGEILSLGAFDLWFNFNEPPRPTNPSGASEVTT
ncbi:hypothetical protein DFH06DRAFT_1151449 [Mycena polygramma]|nr:hypothetical protein DFH06DRAFT_1151449 [Mycena polygramma]